MNKSHNISSAIRRVAAVKHDLQKNMELLLRSTIYKKGEEPTYSFEELRVKRKDLITELVWLNAHIAKTNAITLLPNGTLLGVVVQELIQLKGTISLLESLQTKSKTEYTTTEFENHYGEDGRLKPTKVETSRVCTYTERQQIEELEELRAEFAETNRLVEACNQNTRLQVD